MSEAVHAKDLSKTFRVYEHPKDLLLELITGSVRHTPTFALRDVSFSIETGEVLGIIGRNGAGKSTLLKILAGVLEPSAGSIAVNGNVSAILELGTGFNPEYTGRENIVIGSMCLGLSRAEAEARIEDVIGFSELGSVIDHPFKTYSSGMQARLTFSTAIHVEPEILIVDEALSVGDALFQRKCFERIRQIAESGRTILFVSHAMSAIYDLCDSCLLLEDGKLVATGDPRQVSYEYERILQSSTREGKETPLSRGSASEVLETPVQVVSVSLESCSGRPVEVVEGGAAYNLRIRVRCNEACHRLNIGFRVARTNGSILYSTNTQLQDVQIDAKGGTELDWNLRFECSLAPGRYWVDAGVTQIENAFEHKFLHHLVEARPFEVVGPTQFNGDVDLGFYSTGITPTCGTSASVANEETSE